MYKKALVKRAFFIGGCMKKVVCSSVLFILLFCSGLFALPGIDEWMPTASGEYVYYRDYTFTDESYIGFLQYDAGTYAVRYYSLGNTSDKKNPIPPKDIQILLTMKKDSAFVELTGEKIIGELGADDVDIVNYLHDLVYEFNARRKKMNGKDFSKSLVSTEIYEQFGGEVTMTYKGYIPLYSLDAIRNEKGDLLFQAVTIGTLLDSSDTSFADFAGFKNLTSLKRVADKKANLDEFWKTNDNIVYSINNKALYMVNTFTFEESYFSNLPYSLEDYFIRNFLTSTEGDYIYLPFVSIQKEKGERKPYLLLTSTIMRTEESMRITKTKDAFQKDFKVLIRENENSYWLCTLTMENDYYNLNKSYFDNYLKTFVLP